MHTKYASAMLSFRRDLIIEQFFPVIGRLVADLIQGTLPDELVRKFAVNRPPPSVPVADTDFGQKQPAELDEDELCTPEDLLP
jgi:sarcosine oxidase/L-pipecolate oxidase